MPRQLRSTVREDGTLQLALASVEAPEPSDDQVVIRVEAAPLNPSDLGPMLGPADVDTMRTEGAGADVVVTFDIPENLRSLVQARVGRSLPMGNEGAGVVVAAGRSPEVQALVGRAVATWGGGMYSQLRVAPVDQCLALPDDVTPAQGASAFVNPLTTLGMISTMRLEGHRALVHAAAASNLGQMLVKLCQAEGIPLVNIVRRSEQVDVLNDLGAEHVCNSSDDDFMKSLIAAVDETDATLGFDAIGGGRLASNILTAMEAVQSRKGGTVGNYGSARHKQVYLYGGLDRSPTELTRGFGMAWGIGGWLLPNHLARLSAEEVEQMRQRVAAEITTTFASSYTAEISLAEMLDPDTIRSYARQATGEKYLVNPNQGLGA